MSNTHHIILTSWVLTDLRALTLHRSRTAVAPLERLKILLQVSCLSFLNLIGCIYHFLPLYAGIEIHSTGQSCVCACLDVSWMWYVFGPCHMQVQNPHNIKYNGTVQGLKYIWRTEGFRGLFKGNGTNCARIVPNSAVKFFSYEQASK